MKVRSGIPFLTTAIVVLLSTGRGAPRLQAFPLPPDSTARNRYDSILARIDAERSKLAEAYQEVKTASAKERILEDARTLFVASIAEVLAPVWFGTPWEFYGTTETPGEGTIACGYFVSTLLRDAALKVERVKMAQQASERIIKTVARESEIRRFRNVSIATFADSIQSWGSGLYIVGLDYHVGFLYHDGTTLHFIHSCYIGPKCVLSEAAETSAILASSKYRVVGKISANNDLIEKWLLGTKVKTAG